MKHVGNRFVLTTVALFGVLCATTLLAQGRRGAPKAEEVTLIGVVIDLQSYMTEKCPGDDLTKCTRDNIRGGVPAALETDDGLVLIGMGDKGPARLLVPLANQTAEVSGKLYDKDGLLYLDMSAAKVYKEESEEDAPAAEEAQEPEEP